MEQSATPNPATGAAEKNHKKLQKSGSSAEGEGIAAAEETSDGAAEASNSNAAVVNNEVHSPLNRRFYPLIRNRCHICMFP